MHPEAETRARGTRTVEADLVQMSPYVRQELRQALRTIDLYAQLLERPDDRRGAVEETEAVEYIRGAVDRLEHLLEGVRGAAP